MERNHVARCATLTIVAPLSSKQAIEVSFHRLIDRAGRLVQEDIFGCVDDDPGKADPLLFAQRK